MLVNHWSSNPHKYNARTLYDSYSYSYYYYYHHHHHHHLLYAGYFYTYIPETNYVPREYSVAAILLLLFMVLVSLVSVLNLLYFYISTFRSMCAVPNMVVFWIIIIIIIIIMDVSCHRHFFLVLLLNQQ